MKQPKPPLSAKQEAQQDEMNRETDEANAAARAAPGWTRDNGRLTQKLDRIEAFTDVSTLAAVQGWTDQEAFNAETFADAMLAPGAHVDPVGDWRTADFKPIDLPAVLAEWEIAFTAPPPDSDEAETDDAGDEQPRFDPQTDTGYCFIHPNDDTLFCQIMGVVPDVSNIEEAVQEAAIEAFGEGAFRTGVSPAGDHFAVRLNTPADAHIAAQQKLEEAETTFTAEEIAAGETPVVQEDEAETVAAELGLVIDPSDPIITLQTPTAPVAVRLLELQRLVDNRWLYKTADGFSPNTHPPYVEPAVAEAWVRAGLAEWEPSAGNFGGIRVTPEARSLLARNRADAA